MKHHFTHKGTSSGSLSHLRPTQTQIKVMKVPQAFVGEARAAAEAGDIGQGREIVAEQDPSLRLNVHFTVTETSCVGLQVKGQSFVIYMLVSFSLLRWK